MRKSIKKLLPITLILVLSFTLMACGKKQHQRNPWQVI